MSWHEMKSEEFDDVDLQSKLNVEDLKESRCDLEEEDS